MSTINENPDLTALMGQTDAVFHPVRDWSSNGAAAARFAARQQFAAAGLPIRRAGVAGDQAAQKRAERALNKLEHDGAVITGRKNGKRQFWKLAPATYWKLRALTGSYGYWATIPVLWSIDAYERLLPSDINKVWEGQLAGVQSDSELTRRCREIQEMILPALVFGWAMSNSDRDGRVAYALTDSGRAVLADPSKHEPADPGDYDPSTGPVYDRAFTDQISEFRRLAPTQANHIAVPLGCGSWDVSTDKRLTPFTIYTRPGKLRTVEAIERAYHKLIS